MKHSGGKRRCAEEASPRTLRPGKRPRDMDDADNDLEKDIKEILGLLKQIKERAHRDGQKKCAQIVASIAADIQTMLQDTRSKFQKERQSLLKALSKTSKECESSLKNEYTKFQATYDMLCKDKDAHVQKFRDLCSKVEDERKKLLLQYEEQRKEENIVVSELDKTFTEKVANAEQSLRKMKQDDKSFNIFRKSIGSVLECGSDDDFEPEDDCDCSS